MTNQEVLRLYKLNYLGDANDFLLAYSNFQKQSSVNYSNQAYNYCMNLLYSNTMLVFIVRISQAEEKGVKFSKVNLFQMDWNLETIAKNLQNFIK